MNKVPTEPISINPYDTVRPSAAMLPYVYCHLNPTHLRSLSTVRKLMWLFLMHLNLQEKPFLNLWDLLFLFCIICFTFRPRNFMVYATFLVTFTKVNHSYECYDFGRTDKRHSIFSLSHVFGFVGFNGRVAPSCDTTVPPANQKNVMKKSIF